MADATDETLGRTLDARTRHRLLALLRQELTRAGDQALARGMTPQELTDQFDARITRLRATIGKLSDGISPPDGSMS